MLLNIPKKFVSPGLLAQRELRPCEKWPINKVTLYKIYLQIKLTSMSIRHATK